MSPRVIPPTMPLLALLSCLPLAAAFHWSAILPPAASSTARSLLGPPDIVDYDRRRRRYSSGRGSGTRSALPSLHFDDLSDLLHDEPPTNGMTNDGYDDISASFPRLQTILTSPPVSYPTDVASSILTQLSSAGFLDDNDMVQFARGFVAREEVLSRILMDDFGWTALDAHRGRVGLMALVRTELGLIEEGASVGQPRSDGPSENDVTSSSSTLLDVLAAEPSPELGLPSESKADEKGGNTTISTEETATKPAPWKSVLVNDKAKVRRGKDSRAKGGSTNSGGENESSSTAKDSYSYGLLQATTDPRDSHLYSNLYAELDRFWTHMTVPQTSAASEAVIRAQTAKVYMTHARLFLGWIVDARGVLEGKDPLEVVEAIGGEGKRRDDEGEGKGKARPVSPLGGMTTSRSTDDARSVRVRAWQHAKERLSSANDPRRNEDDREDLKQSISLCDIFPTSETESAAPVLQYVLWLRSERQISPNYEANILRGLIKLVKFRFAHELSSSTIERGNDGASAFGGSTRASPLDDLPIVVELRKLHREAGSKGKKAPRSSDEGKKWLEWSEYLEVIRLLKSDINEMISSYERRLDEINESKDGEASVDGRGEKKLTRATEKSLQSQRKEIATAFQQHLILSFFACVPDRQRTYRELQLGRNFIRMDGEDGESAVWVIKHNAEDYKTGSTYGERPPLPLTASLTPEIDDFLDRWRPALVRQSSGDSDTADDRSFLFLQPRTGNPLTANTVYQIVSRCCYKYKNKKTNPHLLRDMIVTHVRKNADASEKELEALALFMGHSIQMQRDSYDRRTLEQKVSPAVKLMQNMNSMGGDANG